MALPALAPLELSEAQLDGWKRDGFIVLEDFASPAEVAALLGAGRALLESFEPSSNPSIFSTTRQTETSDEHFLRSSDCVSFFLEEGVVDEKGLLNRPKERAVNKIGHALHELEPTFTAWTRSQRIASLLRQLGLARPAAMQSMYICKQPDLGGVVVPHQDACFLHTTPDDTCLGLWVALEDATLQNGCLWVIPGSQAAGVNARFVLTPERTTRWAGDVKPSYPSLGENEANARAAGYVPLEARAGMCVMLHGASVHASALNTSSRSRHAYSVHYVSADAAWEKTNWLQKAAPPTPLP